jgi:hypothetical protein
MTENKKTFWCREEEAGDPCHLCGLHPLHHRPLPPPLPLGRVHTDKKEKKIFLIYKDVQTGAVAKSYMRKGFL